MAKINFQNLKEPYLIGEIGINHNGDMQIAKKLIDASFGIGWDCVKFQKRNPDVCVPEHQKSVMRDTPWGRMSYLDYKYKVEFDKKEYDYIDEYCSHKPIQWSASVWDIDSLRFLMNYKNLPYIKIPSAMLTDNLLIEESAKTQKQLIISTGMSTLEEVDNAVNLIMKHGAPPVILHSNSCYPAPLKDLNLRVIPFFIERYDCIIGYSGHEFSVEPTVAAVILGAKVIERHITIDHNLWGTDQKSSLSILAMDTLYRRVKEIEVYLGKSEKIVTEGEKIIRKKLRKN
jgi:N-acetylneuraminate synthase